jgi:enoyl-CoA hydratase/carnithine racemase
MKNVIYKKAGRIAYITLNRPQKLNALTIEMIDELEKIWEDFKKDDKCWVAILSGLGKAFCAGAAIEQLPKGKWSISQSITVGDRTVGPGKHNIWKPVIAALHGYVFGGGLWIALECDLRIAAENTLFSLPEPRIGIPTSFAAFLSDILPRGIVEELLLVGDRIDAQRAYNLGLVNRIVETDKLMEEATKLAKRMCQNAPIAVQAMKEVIFRSKNLSYKDALNLTEEIFRPVYDSADAKEGRKAFKEKREPQWQSR